MNGRITLLLVWLSAAVNMSVYAQEVRFYTGDLDALRELAERENKLMFVSFSASWCMPCQWMDKNTYTDRTLAAFINRYYLPVKIDIDDYHGLLAKEKYRVILLPSMMVFDSRGVVIGRYEETMTASRLQVLLRRHYREQTGLEPAEVLPTVVVPVQPPPPDLPLASPAEGRDQGDAPDRGSDAPARTDNPPRSPSIGNRPINQPPGPAGSPVPAKQPAAAGPSVATPPRPMPLTGNALPSRPSAAPAKTTAPATPAPPVSAPAGPQNNFGVQVGVFTSYENAMRQVADLERQVSDQPVNVFVSETSGKRVYRILIGVFDNRTAAENFNRQLESRRIAGFVKDMREL